MSREIDTIARDLACQLADGDGRPIYLWYRRPRKGETIAVPVLAENNPDPAVYLLAHPTPWRLVWSPSQVRNQLVNILRYLPILGEERIQP